jgi:hypothetical protein
VWSGTRPPPRTRRRRTRRAGYDGRYISTTAASTSTQPWIARTLDHLAALDAKAGWARAMTFTSG